MAKTWRRLHAKTLIHRVDEQDINQLARWRGYIYINCIKCFWLRSSMYDHIKEVTITNPITWCFDDVLLHSCSAVIYTTIYHDLLGWSSESREQNWYVTLHWRDLTRYAAAAPMRWTFLFVVQLTKIALLFTLYSLFSIGWWLERAPRCSVHSICSKFSANFGLICACAAD
jgi:hypothetical protein